MIFSSHVLWEASVFRTRRGWVSDSRMREKTGLTQSFSFYKGSGAIYAVSKYYKDKTLSTYRAWVLSHTRAKGGSR